MKFILNHLKKNVEPLFLKGGKLEKLHPLYDMQETILFTTDHVTQKGPHVRDSLDLKRLMITVVFALIPCTLFGIYNAGYQQALAAGLQLSPLEMFLNGAILCVPIIVVSYGVGGFWEMLFAVVRKHPISEGFLVTGLLFPLVLPPTIPLWQVAVGLSFGVVIGKEIFGGTGMNILNPALTGRAFLFFSFPAKISGDKVWIAHNPQSVVDGFTGATPLSIAAATPYGASATEQLNQVGYSSFDLWNLFEGFYGGSIGETSVIACLIGAAILILTGVGSWQIMISTVVGALIMSSFLGMFASESLPGFLSLPPVYHLLVGGFAFGTVFMATDPVSAAQTGAGKYIYGFMIGMLCILIRIWNPAYPEGMMLSILFMNLFAPLIDHFIMKRNITRRLKRATAG